MGGPAGKGWVGGWGVEGLGGTDFGYGPLQSPGVIEAGVVVKNLQPLSEAIF